MRHASARFCPRASTEPQHCDSWNRTRRPLGAFGAEIPGGERRSAHSRSSANFTASQSAASFAGTSVETRSERQALGMVVDRPSRHDNLLRNDTGTAPYYCSGASPPCQRRRAALPAQTHCPYPHPDPAPPSYAPMAGVWRRSGGGSSAATQSKSSSRHEKRSPLSCRG